MKNLVCHEGAIGDFILSIPSIRLIKKRYGAADFLGRDFVRELFGTDGFFERHFFSGSSPFSCLFAEKRKPLSRETSAEKILGAYERAFIFTNNPCSQFVYNIKGLIPEVRTVLQRPDGSGLHAAEFQARQLGGNAFFSPLGSRAAGIRRIVLHPGSGSKAKRWPLRNYFELVKRLACEKPDRERGDVAFTLVAGPAEEDLAGRLKAFAADNTRRCSVLVEPSFAGLRENLEGALLYVGGDSGITHLAAALGVKTVAVFGPTDYRLWAPLGEDVTVVRRESGCSPCGQKMRSCGHRICLEGIGVEEVFYSCISVLTRARMEE